jgi:hypothetical protein
MPSLLQTLHTNFSQQVDCLQATTSARIPWYLASLDSQTTPEHPQRVVITRNAYFDKDFSSALAFDSKPFL